MQFMTEEEIDSKIAEEKRILEILQNNGIKFKIFSELEELENSETKIKYIDNAEIFINLALFNLLIDFRKKKEEEGTILGILDYLKKELVLYYENEF